MRSLPLKLGLPPKCTSWSSSAFLASAELRSRGWISLCDICGIPFLSLLHLKIAATEALKAKARTKAAIRRRSTTQEGVFSLAILERFPEGIIIWLKQITKIRKVMEQNPAMAAIQDGLSGPYAA